MDLSISIITILNQKMDSKNASTQKPSGTSVSHATIRGNYISANTQQSTGNGPRPTATYGTDKPGTTFVRKY